MMQPRKMPIRTCVSCRTSLDKKSLIRIVRTSDGEVRLDPTGKAPGRGAYLCGAKECATRAIKANKLGRALRCEIPERVKTELESLTGNDTMTAENRDMKAE
ncbi:MAG: YlxR family protein [Armatimonadetes bacterium]|nr:YlxR family protein [Armatimonadota bacterium]